MIFLMPLNAALFLDQLVSLQGLSYLLRIKCGVFLVNADSCTPGSSLKLNVFR